MDVCKCCVLVCGCVVVVVVFGMAWCGVVLCVWWFVCGVLCVVCLLWVGCVCGCLWCVVCYVCVFVS